MKYKFNKMFILFKVRLYENRAFFDLSIGNEQKATTNKAEFYNNLISKALSDSK